MASFSSVITAAALMLALPHHGSPSQEAGKDATERNSWGFESARHLLQRAGFGASWKLVRACEELGREEAVALIIELTRKPIESFPTPRYAEIRPGSLPARQQNEIRARAFKNNRETIDRFRSWWFERMLESESPLTEKMTLFWHGFFTSSQMAVRHAPLMIDQIQLLRRHAVDNFAELLHDVSRDPAMLRYLNVGQSQKRNPNENFAREVMELFTIGQGQYTEQDIKEASRAFTGWTERDGRFFFDRERHDRGIKTVLGRRGPLDGDDVLDILLAHPAAPRHLATHLLSFFVIDPPPPSMIDRYARLLRRHSWELRPVLEALFSDQGFYDQAYVGARILGPVEWVVSIARRLEERPPGAFLDAASSTLGQVLLFPPSVQGWESGITWITTSTLMNRRRIIDSLLNGLELTDPQAWRMAFPSIGRGGPGYRELRWRARAPLHDRIDLAVDLDATFLVETLCDRYLAVPITEQTRESLVLFVNGRTAALGENEELDARFWRDIVAMILSIPEAHLG